MGPILGRIERTEELSPWLPFTLVYKLREEKTKGKKNPHQTHDIRHSVEGFALQLHSVTVVCLVM